MYDFHKQKSHDNFIHFHHNNFQRNRKDLLNRVVRKSNRKHPLNMMKRKLDKQNEEEPIYKRIKYENTDYGI
jgi:hypothetical protein